MHGNGEAPTTRPMVIAKSSWMMTLASIAVVIAALYLGKGVLLPLTLAANVASEVTVVSENSIAPSSRLMEPFLW